MILEKVYDELMAQIEDLKKAVAGGSGGGTKDYDKLDNRPKVNNITLSGNKKSSDLKIAYSMTEAEYAAATKNAESIYCLQENATTFEEEDETASTYIHWSESGTGHVASWVYTPSNQDFTGCTAVECDDAAITIDQFQVVEGNVQVFLSCEDTTQIGETVTFTFTLTQAAGSTRIMKNGLEFGRSDLKVSGVFKPSTPLDVSTSFTELPFNIYGHKAVALIVNNTTDISNGAYSEPAFFNIDSYADFYGVDGATTAFKVTVAGYSDRSPHIEFRAGGTGVRVTTASGTGGAGYKPILYGIIVYD